MSLMGIGEFARLSRLSPKALRLYQELGLLAPARVDQDSGYRWYASRQLERARLVASLRQLGVPLAQIKKIVDLEGGAAAEQIAAHWAAAEADHTARRQLAGYLVDRLNGKGSVMYDVNVRDIPARSLLCLLGHAHRDELQAMGRDLIARLRPVATPRAGDAVTAPFIVFHGEVSEDSDGPAEWCWPVPADEAAGIAARFPDLTLRTEPAHQEAFADLGQTRLSSAQLLPVLENLGAWAAKEHRQPSGGLRQILVTNPESGGNGPDLQYAIPLRAVSARGNGAPEPPEGR